jgi:hypothetical protein
MVDKLLSADVYRINASRSERNAILKLQGLCPSLSNSERVALSVLLTHSYSVTIGRSISVAASEAIGQDLTTAILQIPALSPTIQLALAIELLEAQNKN